MCLIWSSTGFDLIVAFFFSRTFHSIIINVQSYHMSMTKHSLFLKKWGNCQLVFKSYHIQPLGLFFL